MKAPQRHSIFTLRAFTLLEVIVSLLLVGIVSAILLPILSPSLRQTASAPQTLQDQLSLREEMENLIREIKAEKNAAEFFDESFRSTVDNLRQGLPEWSIETAWLRREETSSGEWEWLPATTLPPYEILSVQLHYRDRFLTSYFFNPETEEAE